MEGARLCLGNPYGYTVCRNVPDDIYGALRKRAEQRGTSIAAEVIALLKRDVPTAKVLARRRRLLEHAMRISSQPALRPGPPAEEMPREERDR